MENYARKYMTSYHTCTTVSQYYQELKFMELNCLSLVTLSIFHCSFVIKRSFRSWIRRMKWQNYFWEINRERKTTIAKQINKQNATPCNNGRKFLCWFICFTKDFSFIISDILHNANIYYCVYNHVNTSNVSYIFNAVFLSS